MKNKTSPISLLLINAGIFVAILGLMEITILCFFWFPSISGMLPDSLRYYPVKLYTDIGRTVTREFSSWDPELTYTLTPSTSVRHNNREFDVVIQTNRKGVRDDERSLLAPEMIMLGDSFTMGFGVEQNNTYPQLIEKSTGMTVLNAGIESYGTAREVLLLDRFDVSNLRYLVVQYCPNDLKENLSFISNQFRLDTMNKESFNSTYQHYKEATKYYFGQYLWYLVTNIIPESKPLPSEAEKKHQNYLHAKAFVESLQKLKILGNKVNLITLVVIDTNATYLLKHEPEFDNKLFLNSLESIISSNQYSDFITNMNVIDVMSGLVESDRFVLDGHINANGHKKIASEILQVIN